MVAGAQQQTETSATSRGASAATKSGIADGASSPDEMGNRRPLYRLRKSDVLEFKFNFASEFDQTLSVQPDGFIALRDMDELYAEGLRWPSCAVDPPGLCHHAARSGSHHYAQGFRSLISLPPEQWPARESTNCAATP